MTQGNKDPVIEASIGDEHVKALGDLPEQYPELRTLRITFKHDPTWYLLNLPKDVRYGASRHEVAAWEDRCLLTRVVKKLRAYSFKHMIIKEVRLDQNTYVGVEAGIARKACGIDGRDVTVEEIVHNMMDLPHSVIRV